MDGYCIDRTILTSKDMQMILAGLRGLDSVSGKQILRSADGENPDWIIRVYQWKRLYAD